MTHLELILALTLAAAVLPNHISSAASKLQPSVVEASSRAEQTMEGLFQYYWKQDPKNKHIKFFFSCGQIGGGDGQSCTCQNAAACTDCFRWWDGVSLESVATYGIYMNSKNHSDVADTIYAHSPYNAKWQAKKYCTNIDDFAWYGMAYLRIYEWLKDPKWLNYSIELHDWIWKFGWPEPCGGFVWKSCGNQMYMDSITIVQMLHLSSKLAYMLPNESRFLHSAERIWNWFFSFDNGYGLMSEKYLVSTGAMPLGCCNATTKNESIKCYNSKVSGTSYNQGLLMSAGAYLYLGTGNKTYLNVSLRAVNAILTNYTTKDGILIDEPRSYQSYQGGQCTGWLDPGGDWFSFNGIFMVHLGYFTELLHENGTLPKDLLQRINALVEKTSDSAWAKSAVWPPVFSKIKDACSPGTTKNPKITAPKFHWWWGQKVTKQIMPPDPRQFFHHSFLRCSSNPGTADNQIWEGKMASEDTCRDKCQRWSNCSKYTFDATGQYLPLYNCWLWSYNRSDHSCHQTENKWFLGIKRPDSHASCAGKCGSSEPQKLQSGGVCYCDSQCPHHTDCCLDYADYCRGDDRSVSCKGMCNKIEAQPIPGGGYCWCFSGCNPWMTDNNSDGSCCIDYDEQCLSLEMPTCLDARSQGSALNLFIAHVKLAQIMSKV